MKSGLHLAVDPEPPSGGLVCVHKRRAYARRGRWDDVAKGAICGGIVHPGSLPAR
jgi:hypothetical protein